MTSEEIATTKAQQLAEIAWSSTATTEKWGDSEQPKTQTETGPAPSVKPKPAARPTLVDEPSHRGGRRGRKSHHDEQFTHVAIPRLILELAPKGTFDLSRFSDAEKFAASEVRQCMDGNTFEEKNAEYQRLVIAVVYAYVKRVTTALYLRAKDDEKRTGVAHDYAITRIKDCEEAFHWIGVDPARIVAKNTSRAPRRYAGYQQRK